MTKLTIAREMPAVSVQGDAKKKSDPNGNRFVLNFLTDVENAVLSYCRERVAEIDLPSQKLVVLARA